MFETVINGVQLFFETEKSVFSPNKVDKGTSLMLSSLNLSHISQDDTLLDLGCGYGAVGIYFAKHLPPQNVLMSDIDETSLNLARKNAIINNVPDIKIVKSDGFSNINDTNFSLILCNPPYHADFSVAKHFIEKGFNRLQIGGKMLMVTKRKTWYKNKFTAIFGGVGVTETDGYCVFCAAKRNMHYANAKKSRQKL
ncbi:MAG: methyltransferase [Defluviitaleaceae bacterium]|nr:methyltransferase [Defluviitaleaceae bacterium]